MALMGPSWNSFKLKNILERQKAIVAVQLESDEEMRS